MRDWKGTLSTIFAASIATLLIWTWAADRTRELRTLSGTVILRPSDAGERFVDPAQPQSVSVSVKASPASLTRLQAALEQGLVLQLDTDGMETGMRSAVLGPLIERTAEVRGTDADISSVRPARIDVRVGAMVPVRMPVVARVPLVTLWGPAEVQPTEVVAMVPETSAEAASKEAIEAVVNATDLPGPATPWTPRCGFRMRSSCSQARCCSRQTGCRSPSRWPARARPSRSPRCASRSPARRRTCRDST